MPYKNKEDRLEQSRRWTKNNKAKSLESKRAWRKKNPDYSRRRRANKTPEDILRHRANYRFRNAIKKGWIVRKAGKLFHHIDYSRPYYGMWLTSDEHQKLHAGLQVILPQAIDYWPIVKCHARSGEFIDGLKASKSHEGASNES